MERRHSTAATGRYQRSKLVWTLFGLTLSSQAGTRGETVRNILHILAAPSTKWVDYRAEPVYHMNGRRGRARTENETDGPPLLWVVGHRSQNREGEAPPEMSSEKPSRGNGTQNVQVSTSALPGSMGQLV